MLAGLTDLWLSAILREPEHPRLFAVAVEQLTAFAQPRGREVSRQL